MPFPKVPEAELAAPRGFLILIPLPFLFLDPLLLICIVGITRLFRLIIKLLILTILIVLALLALLLALLALLALFLSLRRLVIFRLILQGLLLSLDLTHWLKQIGFVHTHSVRLTGFTLNGLRFEVRLQVVFLGTRIVVVSRFATLSLGRAGTRAALLAFLGFLALLFFCWCN